MTHFDRIDMVEGYTNLRLQRVRNGIPISDLCQDVCLELSTPTASERVLSLETDVVLKVVRMAVKK